jgi:N-methylhydantoinase B/oxoprolinase/acetone carboxylase alpha subunit
VENSLTIDSKYYLEHQIEKPVFQIFELVMKKPETIIEDLKRSMNNAKSGNQSITSWFKAIDKNNNVSKIAAEEAEKNKKKKIELKLDELDDEEEDLLGFEEEVDEYANIEEV